MVAVHSLKSVALKAADQLPKFSVVLPQALSLCAREEDISAGALAAVADRDVVITGNLVSLANSAFYARNAPVTSLRAAIVRLGMRKTRNVLLGLSVVRSFRAIDIPGKWSSQQFNRHSLATAVFSDLIAQNVRTEDAEWAFAAGLLHDIGLLLIAAAFPERLGSLLEFSAEERQLAAQEREMLGFTHYELGADFLARWNYPLAVHQAIRFEPDAALEFSRPLKLAPAIRAATMLADARGHIVLGANKPETDQGALLEALRIGQPARFLSGFELEWEGFEQGA